MSAVKVRIPTPLRPFTGGASEVSLQGQTVREALVELERRHGGILERVIDGEGRVRAFVNIYVGERDVRAVGGLDSALPDTAVISIVPAVAGGARSEP